MILLGLPMGSTGKKSQQMEKKRKTSHSTGPSQSRAPKKSKKRFSLMIFRDWCKACGICSAFCPKGVIGKDDDASPLILLPDKCSGCRFCELHCPDFAINVLEKDDEPHGNAT